MTDGAVGAVEHVEALKREKAWRSGSQDPVFFSRAFVKIRVPGRGLIPFDLYDAQVETLRLWRKHRYTVALKARQIGFSTLVGVYVLWLSLFVDNHHTVMISRKEDDAQDLLRKTKVAYRNLPEWLKERAPALLVDNAERLEFANGSVIESLPSASDPARGKSVDLVVVDEWGFLPNAEDAWASIEPVADVGGSVIGLGTANGSGTFYHDLYVGARAGINRFVPIFWSWRAAEHRKQDWYDEKCRTMREWQLHQEYPDNDVECWIKSGRMVFDYQVLQRFPLAAGWQGDLRLSADQPSSPPRAYDFSASKDGRLLVWQEPERGHRYVLGADVAEGLEYGDWSTVHVIDVASGDVVAAWHGHTDPDLFGSDILWAIGWYYNGAYIGVEVNNHGLTTCLALRDAGYPNLYFRHTYDERLRKRSRKIGWRTTTLTKPMMVDELAEALRDETIHLHCSATKAELEQYTYDDNGRMSGSPHDDRVISLAIANQMLKHRHASAPVEKVSDWGTFDWWAADADRQTATTVKRIGEHNRRQPDLLSVIR